MGYANRGQLSKYKFSFLNEDLMARAKRKPILSTSPELPARTCSESFRENANSSTGSGGLKQIFVAKLLR